jgi:hypothetical protein
MKRNGVKLLKYKTKSRTFTQKLPPFFSLINGGEFLKVLLFYLYKVGEKVNVAQGLP